MQAKPISLVCLVVIAFSAISVQPKALNTFSYPQSALNDGQVAANPASSDISTNGLNSQSAMYENQEDETKVKNTKDKKADYSYGLWPAWHQYPGYPWNYGNCASCPYPYPYPYPYPQPQQHAGHYQYPYNNYPYWYGGLSWWYPYSTQAVHDKHARKGHKDGGEKKKDEKKAKISQ